MSFHRAYRELASDFTIMASYFDTGEELQQSYNRNYRIIIKHLKYIFKYLYSIDCTSNPIPKSYIAHKIKNLDSNSICIEDTA